MRHRYHKKISLKAAIYAAITALTALSLMTAVFAVDWSAGAGAERRPYEATPDDGGGIGGNAAGGRQGENYNSPAANGGGNENGGDAGYGDRGREDAMYEAPDDNTDETFEEGEVLGVTDSENSATVGIIIAILIAVAVIVLIIALLPRGTTGA